MRILVTGGAGFVGSHLCEKLVSMGHQVVSIDNLSTGSEKNLPDSVQLIKSDVLEIEKYYNDLPELDSIIHLSAQTSVPNSLANPLFDFKNNAQGTATVLEVARKKKVSDFRMVSSAAIYGDTQTLPTTEKADKNPMSMYGMSKLISENLALFYSKMYGLSGFIFRPSNIYGPRQRNDLEGGVVSIFAKVIAENGIAKIYGDGKQTRDFIYVKDVANFLSSKLGETESFDTVNLSSGKELSIIDLWVMMCEVYGYESDKYEFLPPRIGDIYHSLLSNKKLIDIFDKVSSTEIKEGLDETIAYFKGMV